MRLVPTQPLPSQVFNVILEGQSITVTLRQLASGLFMNIQLNGVQMLGLVVCQNLNRIVRNSYFGMAGDFIFYDENGTNLDPYFTGLGSQFSLYYLEAVDLPNFAGFPGMNG